MMATAAGLEETSPAEGQQVHQATLAHLQEEGPAHVLRPGTHFLPPDDLHPHPSGPKGCPVILPLFTRVLFALNMHLTCPELQRTNSCYT